MIKGFFRLIFRAAVILFWVLFCMLFLLKLFFYMPRIKSMFSYEN